MNDTRTTAEILRDHPENEIDRRPHILARARWVLGQGQRTDTGWISEHDVCHTMIALDAELAAERQRPTSVADALRDARVRAGTHWVARRSLVVEPRRRLAVQRMSELEDMLRRLIREEHHAEERRLARIKRIEEKRP